MTTSLSIQKQSGMATLIFSLVILFTLTLTTIFGARVGLLDEKMSSNDYRSKEAMMAAEAGMDAAITNIQNTGITSGTYTGTVSTTGGVTVSYSYVVTRPQTTPVELLKIVSTGCVGTSACGGANVESSAALTQYMSRVSLLGSAPSAPMVLAGNLDPTGSYQLVGKEGGTITCGVGTLDGSEAKCSGLLSVWSKTLTGGWTGAAATCYFDDFIYTYADAGIDDVYGWNADVPMCATTSVTSPGGTAKNCYCWNGPTGKGSVGPYVARTDNVGGAGHTITESDKISMDIVSPPVVDTPVTNFPTDLFAYVFNGTPRTSYTTIKAAAATLGHQLSDCSTINQNSKGLYWITGACDLPSVVGSPEHPVLIVVENNEIRTGGTEGFGLLYAFDQNGSGTATYKATGSSFWYGGIIVDGNSTVAAGGTRLIFSSGVFVNLNKDSTLVTVAVVPGSWRDF